MPIGLEDSSKYPNLFAALLEDTEFDWTEEDLVKLSQGNILRAMRQMESVRDNQVNKQPEQDILALDAFTQEELTCNSAVNII